MTTTTDAPLAEAKREAAKEYRRLVHRLATDEPVPPEEIQRVASANSKNLANVETDLEAVRLRADANRLHREADALRPEIDEAGRRHGIAKRHLAEVLRITDEHVGKAREGLRQAESALSTARTEVSSREGEARRIEIKLRNLTEPPQPATWGAHAPLGTDHHGVPFYAED